MKSKITFLFLTGIILGGLSIFLVVSSASAQTQNQGSLPLAQAATPAAPTTSNTPAPSGADNGVCLGCHSKPGMETTLPSGEILYLTVDQQTFQSSVHGQKGYACVDCHTNITSYPHPQLTAQDRRDVTLQMEQNCTRCHQEVPASMTNDAHTEARTRANNPDKNAAVCSDCHGAHDVTKPDQPRSRIPQTCARCHSQIFDLYKNSVHGTALIGEGNPDVPSCVDCHNWHNIQGPTNTQFRLFSPNICARCHANKTLMAKYNINTEVFNTYLADFHGTTVEMFQSLAPGQATNKPVCIDCHGVHDIAQVKDPNSPVIKQNLLTTCQKCHPQATTNFPGAWLSHYPPSPQHNSLVYYVSLFYKFFIPTVLGGMAVFVASDAGRRIINRSNRKKESDHEE